MNVRACVCVRHLFQALFDYLCQHKRSFNVFDVVGIVKSKQIVVEDQIEAKQNCRKYCLPSYKQKAQN